MKFPRLLDTLSGNKMDVYGEYLKGKKLDDLLSEARAEQEKDRAGDFPLIQQKNSDYTTMWVSQNRVVDVSNEKKETEASFPYLSPKLVGTKFGRKMIELYEKDECLRSILKTSQVADSVTERFIIGRTFFEKCCGERMIKMQELYYDQKDGVRTLFSFSKISRLVYCPSCAKAIKYTNIFG